MASHEEYVQYIAQQCSDAGTITVRKMFGEYGIYCDGKIFGLICDDQVFIKITQAGREQMPKLETGAPYEGAKAHFVFSEVDDKDVFSDFVRRTVTELTLTEKEKPVKPFDYKKEYKEFYMPPKKPQIAAIPPMNYLAVHGKGDPNEPKGDYQAAVGMLYAVAYTLKMSPKAGYKIEGYFPYTVPPLEGLWQQNGSDHIDYTKKENFEWVAMIRLPDFIRKKDFDWAVAETSRKKKSDFSKVQFFSYEEGVCVQCMHIGSYDAEPKTIAAMDLFAQKNGYETDFSCGRMHHEIYLSDPRKCAAEKCKTVIRHPLKNMIHSMRDE